MKPLAPRMNPYVPRPRKARRSCSVAATRPKRGREPKGPLWRVSMKSSKRCRVPSSIGVSRYVRHEKRCGMISVIGLLKVGMCISIVSSKERLFRCQRAITDLGSSFAPALAFRSFMFLTGWILTQVSWDEVGNILADISEAGNRAECGSGM